MTGQPKSKGYMLDTNVFNDVADEKIRVEEFGGQRVFATHVQLDELKKSKSERAAALTKAFESVDPTSVGTSSARWDVSKWDEANWSPEDGLSERMLKRLCELDAATKKKHRDPYNPSRDVLIAETAIKCGHTLVSGDANLRQLVSEFGGWAVSIDAIRARAGQTDSA
jgi:predicted nucleic acid-binding protein